MGYIYFKYNWLYPDNSILAHILQFLRKRIELFLLRRGWYPVGFFERYILWRILNVGFHNMMNGFFFERYILWRILCGDSQYDGSPENQCTMDLAECVFLSLSRDIVTNTIMASLSDVNHRLELRVPEAFEAYSLIQYKGHNSKFKFFDGLQFRKYFISLSAFYLIIWLIILQKKFEKTSILKIWQLVFFRGVKTQFGEIPLKSYIFRYDKN